MFIRNALARRAGLALGLCALASLPAFADYDNGYGYLRSVEGSATLMQAGSGTRTPAEINQPVLAGDRLWVPERSRVEIVLADRNLLRIDGGSELILERLAASPDSQDRGTVVRLLEGNVQLVVLRDSLGDELPRIDTPNATIYVKDYGVFRIAADQETYTELVVRSGRAEVATDRSSEEVRADEQAFVEGDSRIDVEAGGSYDNLERWADRLDHEGDVDSEYLNDDLRYAAAPLSRYGAWVDVQGTHYWRPRVEAGWRPYWNGRWAYTPSGHTWVSYDPWGWVPDHYGSWDYISGYGWVWQPGYRWAPAWVYWYQGPSYTGWCPTGYYTRYYGSRWGSGFGFHLGVYGWAGGDWGLFGNWTFVSSDYWRGYRNGYRNGYGDGRRDGWHDQWNVRRHAVAIDDLRRRGPLDRGLITTDTRPLTPDVLQDPRHAVAVLSRDPSARRVASRAGGDLPDVSDFIARKPDLPSNLRRAVSTDNDGARLDGTPLRPDTMSRGDRGNRGDRGDRTVAGYPDGVRGARALPGDRGDRGDRTGRDDSGREPGRTPVSDSGREPGSDRGVRALPRDRDRSDSSDRSDRTDRSDRSARPRVDEVVPPSRGGYRDQPGSSRPDRGSARVVPSDRRGSEPGSYERPRPTGRGGYERPSSSSPDRGGYERPPSSPRDYERPSSSRDRGGYERPSPSSPDRGRYDRPSPRVDDRAAPPSSAPSSSSRGGYDRPSSSPRTYERPSPPSSDRGGYDRPSSGNRGGSSARSAPDRRSGGDRGGSSGGRSSRRASPRDGHE